jgi:hypothetical protein
MSRLNQPGMLVVKPQNNVYTGLAFISMLVTAGALVYVVIRLKELGLF